MVKTDLFRYEERGLQTQNQDRVAQLTEAAVCRGSSRVARHLRHHSPHRRHTDNSCQYISRFCTASRVGGTRTRLNNREIILIKRLNYHRYSPSSLLYLSLFTFIHLCLHCIRLLS